MSFLAAVRNNHRRKIDGVFLIVTPDTCKLFEEYEGRMNLLHFLPFSFFRWCENEIIGRMVEQSKWNFVILETIHIMVMAMFLGTIIIVDLRLLGFGMRRQLPAQLAKDLAPWTLTGMFLMIATGIPLFLSEATRLAGNRPLFFKMLFLLLALFIHFTIHRNATRFDSKYSNALNKVAAWLSLISWFGVAVAGRAIALTNPSGS
jgi:hypothetical protein